MLRPLPPPPLLPEGTRLFSLDFEGIPDLTGFRRACCGQFAMTILLRGLGQSIDFETVFRESNPLDIYTAPGSAVEYLTHRGLSVAQHNYAHFRDLRACLERGQPGLVLLRCWFTPHWVVVTGHATNAAGETTHVEVMDNIWGNGAPGRRHHFTLEEFTSLWNWPMGFGLLALLGECRYCWIEPGVEGADAGLQPLVSAYGDVAALSLNNLARGLGHLSKREFFRGLLELAFSMPALGFGIPGKWLQGIGRLIGLDFVAALGQAIKNLGSRVALACLDLEGKWRLR